MKNIAFFLCFAICIAVVSCTENKLSEEVAASLIKERISNMPGRSVSFYLGAITDPGYLSVYRAVATGEYLEMEDNVSVEGADRKMTVIKATEKGEEIFNCEKNRCTVEVCQYSLGGILVLSQKGRFANARYRLKSDCSGEMYELFKPLADRLHVRSEITEETADFELGSDGWKIR